MNIGLFPGAISSQAAFASRRDLNAVDRPASDITLIAGVPIAEGELLELRENGRAYRVTPSLPLSITNNTTPGMATAAFSQITDSNLRALQAGNASSSNFNRALELGDGNIVVAQENTGEFGTTLTLYSPGGQILGSTTLSTSNSYQGLIRLSDTQFVLFRDVSGSEINFTILNNNLTVAVAGQSVATLLYGLDPRYMAAAVLANGDIVFVWRTNTDTLLQRRYAPNGTARAAAETISATAAATAVSILPLSNGQYIIHFRTAAGGFFTRRNSDGTIYSSIVSLDGQSPNASNCFVIDQNAWMAELSNGNIALLSFVNTTAFRVLIYDGTNTLVSTITPPWNDTTGRRAGLVAYDGGFITIANDGGGARICVYNASGLIVTRPAGAVTFFANFDSSSNHYNCFFRVTGNALVCASGGYHGTDGFYYTRLTAVDLRTPGEILGTAFDPTGTNHAISGLVASERTGCAFTLTGRDAVGVAIDSRRVLRGSVIGVARHAASAGELVETATVGSYTLPATQDIITGASFDMRAAALPGNKGQALRRYVSLLGLA